MKLCARAHLSEEKTWPRSMPGPFRLSGKMKPPGSEPGGCFLGVSDFFGGSLISWSAPLQAARMNATVCLASLTNHEPNTEVRCGAHALIPRPPGVSWGPFSLEGGGLWDCASAWVCNCGECLPSCSRMSLPCHHARRTMATSDWRSAPPSPIPQLFAVQVWAPQPPPTVGPIIPLPSSMSGHWRRLLLTRRATSIRRRRCRRYGRSERY
jgi:hypothetical protein